VEYPAQVEFQAGQPVVYQANGFSVVTQLVAMTTTAVQVDNSSKLPDEFRLFQNYPNPFGSAVASPARSGGNPATVIRYNLPATASAMLHVKISIFNIQGQCVRTLVNEAKSAGTYQELWDGRNDADAKVPSGLYLYTMSAGSFRATRRMIVMK
jgi:flagellar hook assembly protein FlgD